MPDDFEYHRKKRPDKTYISKSLSFSSQDDRRFRIASKVFDGPETHAFALEDDEHVIRITGGGRQEIVAKFYEDNRGIFTLTLQRFSTKSGRAHPYSFSFVGDEIPKLLEFIRNLKNVPLPDDQGLNVTDEELQKILLSNDQIKNLIVQNQEIVLQLARSEITTSDLVALGYRKKQLDHFHKLLTSSDYFAQQKTMYGGTEEGVWQNFFEKNKWIFGYGLTYLFLSSMDDRKLEQLVVGPSVFERGKRADAIMKTKGAIEAICFVEIKKPTTPLLEDKSYRAGCWSPSGELTGGVVQLQGTVERAVRSFDERFQPSDVDGNPTGETLFSYKPRSFLIIGSLDEFNSGHGINVEKYRSFELFRQHTTRPEIFTFDELYSRAKFIVQQTK